MKNLTTADVTKMTNLQFVMDKVVYQVKGLFTHPSINVVGVKIQSIHKETIMEFNSFKQSIQNNEIKFLEEEMAQSN